MLSSMFHVDPADNSRRTTRIRTDVSTDACLVSLESYLEGHWQSCRLSLVFNDVESFDNLIVQLELARVELRQALAEKRARQGWTDVPLPIDADDEPADPQCEECGAMVSDSAHYLMCVRSRVRGNGGRGAKA